MSASINLDGSFEVGQNTEDLKGIFTVQHSASVEAMKGVLIVNNASSANLKGIFTVQHSASVEAVKGIFEVGQNTAALKSIMVIRHSASVTGVQGIFNVGQNTVDLFTNFKVAHIGTPINIHADFQVKTHFSGDPQDLKGVFQVDWPDAELFSKFEVKNKSSNDLSAEFEVYQAGEKNLYARMLLKYFFVEGWVDLFADFTVQQSGTAELFSKFEVQQTGTAELKGLITVRHSASAELVADAIIAHTTSIDGPKGVVTIQHSSTAELKGLARVAHFAELDGPKGVLVVQHWADLKSIFTVKQSTSTTLKAVFWTRLPSRLWTNRRYLNGEVSLKELVMGDAILEYVIEGVMEDIQGIMEANEISYATWTDITKVPTLIRRATTFGVVASLYARKSKTFRSRVIPTVTPVNVVVTGDDERAMQYWEGRMEDRINTFLTTNDVDRLLVSTADDAPFFTVSDIVPRTTSEQTWHEWNEQREE